MQFSTPFVSNALILAGLLLLTGVAPQWQPARQRQQTTARRLADIRVPDGYQVSVAAGPDLVDFPMFSTVDETGRLFVFESIGHVYKKTQDALDNPQFRIKLLTDTNGDGVYDKSTVYADKVRMGTQQTLGAGRWSSPAVAHDRRHSEQLERARCQRRQMLGRGRHHQPRHAAGAGKMGWSQPLE